jgi:hypothetical protein
MPFFHRPTFAAAVRGRIPANRGIGLLAAAVLLAGIAAACGSGAAPGADATRGALTLAQMITEVARERTAEPSASPTALAQPNDVPTATIGPTVTPTVIPTVQFVTSTPRFRRATYSGSTPTTDGTSLITRTVTSRCNAAFFVGYVPPVTENAEVPAGSAFTLIWVIRNVGTCTWYPSYFIYWHSGARMDAPPFIDFPEVVPPNKELWLAVHLTAPDEPGRYYQRWYIRDNDYNQFGIGLSFTDPLMVRIVVI